MEPTWIGNQTRAFSQKWQQLGYFFVKVCWLDFIFDPFQVYYQATTVIGLVISSNYFQIIDSKWDPPESGWMAWPTHVRLHLHGVLAL